MEGISASEKSRKVECVMHSCNRIARKISLHSAAFPKCTHQLFSRSQYVIFNLHFVQSFRLVSRWCYNDASMVKKQEKAVISL